MTASDHKWCPDLASDVQTETTPASNAVVCAELPEGIFAMRVSCSGSGGSEQGEGWDRADAASGASPARD
eukprot:3004889-Rhodomonas_salina.1